MPAFEEPAVPTAEDGFWREFHLEMERLAPSSLAASLDPTRPYDGQPHTDTGERGRTEIKGITFRDLRDAFIRACYESSGLPMEQWPGSVYDLPWRDMDIIAVSQNLSCNVEKMMGIYPNVPRPACPTDDSGEPNAPSGEGIEALIERSSLGTPEAKALRASVSDEQVAAVLARSEEIRSSSGETESEPCIRGDGSTCVSDPDACAEAGVCWPGKADVLAGGEQA
jgi:hypothetical protein